MKSNRSDRDAEIVTSSTFVTERLVLNQEAILLQLSLQGPVDLDPTSVLVVNVDFLVNERNPS